MLICSLASMLLAIAIASPLDIRAAYIQILALLFGESTIETLGDIRPGDTTVYPDAVYEIQHAGYREIAYVTGRQVSNLLAFGYIVRFTSIVDQMSVSY